MFVSTATTRHEESWGHATCFMVEGYCVITYAVLWMSRSRSMQKPLLFLPTTSLHLHHSKPAPINVSSTSAKALGSKSMSAMVLATSSRVMRKIKSAAATRLCGWTFRPTPQQSTCPRCGVLHRQVLRLTGCSAQRVGGTVPALANVCQLFWRTLTA